MNAAVRFANSVSTQPCDCFHLLETLPPAPSFFPQSPNTTETVSGTKIADGNGGGPETPTAGLGPGETTVNAFGLPPQANQSINAGTRPQGIPAATANGTLEPPYDGPLVTGLPGAGSGPVFTGSPVPFPPPYASGNESRGAQPSSVEPGK